MRNFKALLSLLISISPIVAMAQLSFQEIEITGKIDVIRNAKLFDDETVDLDLDGDYDILVHSFSNIIWYENTDGTGAFSSAKEIYSNDTFFLRDMKIGDLDGDGDLDIVCVLDTIEPGPNKLGWFTNQGDGTFSEFIEIEEYSTNIHYLEVKDIDGDNDKDILLHLSGEGIIWYENVDGLATFASQALILSYENSISVFMLEDVNGDTTFDVVLYDFVLDQLSWYENLGNVTFSAAQPFHTNLTSGAMVLKKTDFDGDANPDFIASYTNDENLIWYEFDDSGELSRTNINIQESYVASLITTDIDNDGDLDLICSLDDGRLISMRNEDGLGSFSSPTIIDTVTCAGNCLQTNSLSAGDIDGNGSMDIIHSNASSGLGSIYRFTNLDGLGTFGNKKIVSEILHTDEIESVDIDNDGDLDLFSKNNGKFSIHKNLDSNANFGTQELISASDKGSLATALDLDMDGDLDIVSSRYSPEEDIVWYENLDGLGTFGNTQLIESSLGSPYILETGDLDGDGYPDLVVTSYSSSGILYWLKNLNGSGTFSAPTEVATDVNTPNAIQLKDIDADGDLDIILSETYSGLVKWYENTDGAANFAPAVVLTGGSPSRGIHVADLDLDNDLDIITYGNSIRWFENTDGIATFAASQLIGNPASFIQFVEVTDLDGDLDQDVVYKSYSAGGLFWYENLTGNQDFGSSNLIFTSEDVLNPPVTAIGDYNGDFKKDIAYAYAFEYSGYLPASLIVLTNQGEQGNQIVGQLTFDLDASGCDTNDPVLPNVMVTASNGVESISAVTLPNGLYNLNVGQGTYTTTISSTLPTYYGANPFEYDFSFDGIGTTQFGDFCIEAQQEVNDLEIQLFSLRELRPGFETRYLLIYRNVGTTVLEGEVNLNYNEESLNFTEASQVPTAILSGLLTFNIETLLPFESNYVEVSFLVEPPPTVNIDDVLVTTAQSTTTAIDDVPENNEVTLEQVVIGSYDPNDIQVLEGPEILVGDLDNYLHYIIRFQNTGTASAINVQVTNRLDPNLNWETFQILETSHPADIRITNGQFATFTFNDIYLPDSTTNEVASNGFIAYKIKPLSTLQVGDIMSNTADIYFDFNPPIITNTVTTTVVEPLSVPEVETSVCKMYPVPFSNTLNISCDTNNITQVELYDIQGKLLINKFLNGSTDTIDTSILSQGVYILKLKDSTGAIVIKKGIKKDE